MSAATSRGFRKMFRTVIQVVASGGITGLAALLAASIDKSFGPMAAALFGVGVLLVVTYAQNAAETAGKIPTLLPTPSVVTATPTAVTGAAGAVVEMTMEETGDIVGEVLDVVDNDLLDGHPEAGGVGAVLAIIVVCVVILIAAFGFCGDALFEDPDERNDLGAPAWVSDNEPCSDKEACQNRSGDCREVEDGGYCSDDDLSPSFEDSPVRDSFNLGPVCMPMATCHFDGNKEEA